MSQLTKWKTKTEEVKTTEEEPRTPTGKERDFYPYVLILSLMVALCFGIFLGAALRPEKAPPQTEPREEEALPVLPAWMTAAYLTEDGKSRTGEELKEVRDIAVHYVANPGTSAMANRNYFEGPDSDTSAHFIVGLEGEVLALIPTDEKSCATNERNLDTVSVEVCHPDETGAFSETTYRSLVRLLAYLCEEFGLTEENLIRHYDVTGKLCPKYYVEHPDAWEDLKADVKEALGQGESRDAEA